MSHVVGIGEMLWDVFPDGRRLGGAPVNFCCHCGQLGAEAYPVSCVGTDALGDDILQVLASLQLDLSYVAQDAAHPTGTVQVTLDKNGKPTYEICEGVAWDAIPMTAELEALARKADALCFGSLCQRSALSRATIQHSLASARRDASRIFDINLRQAFFNERTITESLRLANVLKLNDEELPVLAQMFDLAGSIEQQLAALIQRFELRLVAYTRGAQGSVLLTPDARDEHPGFPAKVVDSVGAGDAFTAALCVGMLQRKPLAEINEHANRVAAYVCTQQGGTPLLPESIKAG